MRNKQTEAADSTIFKISVLKEFDDKKILALINPGALEAYEKGYVTFAELKGLEVGKINEKLPENKIVTRHGQPAWTVSTKKIDEKKEEENKETITSEAGYDRSLK